MPETRHNCPHCEETVSLSTLRRHKQLYYNEDSHTWIKKNDVLSDSDGETDLELGQEDVNCAFFSDSSLSDIDEGMACLNVYNKTLHCVHTVPCAYKTGPSLPDVPCNVAPPLMPLLYVQGITVTYRRCNKGFVLNCLKMKTNHW